MTLWNKEKVDGVADDNDNKPNWLSEDEKRRCYCDDRGWVVVHLNGTEEVLVAGAGLNEPDDSTDGSDALEKQAAYDRLSTDPLPADGLGSFSDDDEDGKPEYQDPDDGDGS